MERTPIPVELNVPCAAVFVNVSLHRTMAVL